MRELVKERAWLWFLVAGLAISIAAALSGSTFVASLATQAAGWASVTFGLSAVRKTPRTVRRPWVLFASAAAAFLVAGVVRAAHGVLVHHARPFPSAADAIALAGHLMLICGSTLLGHLRAPDRDRAAIIDGAIIAVGLQTLVWSWLLWPYMADPAIPIEDRVINGVYAAMTTVVLATVGRLAVGPGARTISYRLLAGAVVLVFIQDVLVTVDTVGGRGASVGRSLAAPIFVLFGAAALHPARLRIAEAPARLDVRLTWQRVSLLIGALLINPALVALRLAAGDEPNLLLAVASTSMLTLLVLARFTFLARAQERAVKVQRIQQEANGELAAASSRGALHRAGLRAAQRLTNDPDTRVTLAATTGAGLEVIDAVGVDAERAIGVVIASSDVPDALVEGLRSLEPAAVDGVAVVDLADDPATDTAHERQPVSVFVVPLAAQSTLGGALIVTTRRPIPATVRQSLETLASTISLALESAALTEDLLRRQSERRFRALVENSNDIILVVAADRQITFASPAAHRLLGLTEDDLLGSHPARWTHPDDWPSLSRLLDGEPVGPSLDQPGPDPSLDPGGNAGDAPETTGGVEVRLNHANGSYRWFEVRTRDLHQDPEIDGLVVTAREVTDRKQTEVRLAHNEARFRALVQSSADVFAVVDAAGNYSYVSPAVREILGFEPSDLEGTPANGLFEPDDWTTFRADYPELAQPALSPDGLEVRRVEANVRHRNGELRTLDVSVTDLRHDPAVEGIVLNARDITVRIALERDLRHQALHDSLTGLANRAMFTQAATEALEGAAPGSSVVGALVIDLDDFKTVNDSLGHAVGDLLLQEVARRLVAGLSPAELPCRLGGDEFAVLVIDDADRGVEAVSDQVMALLAEPFRIHDRAIRVSCSIGIALATPGATDAEVLLRSADVAMYLAKDRGKSRAAMFEDHLHASVFERLELKADLISAIEDDQLRCLYQPIVSLQTGRITGVEALVRWEHPVRGHLRPDAFIPLAEDTGLVVPLGTWVLREACRQLRQWQLQLPVTSSLTVSVNLSVRQLAHEHLVREVREALADAQLEPSTLTLEITETSLMHDTELTRRRLAELRELGVSLAVDDFGTGYSSLQYVQRFPIDIIKIDRSFVVGLGTDPGDGAVVQSMIELSQRLGVHTVAEGIDSTTQVELLRSFGADLGQGYLFSEPVEASGIDGLLAANADENPRFLQH